MFKLYKLSGNVIFLDKNISKFRFIAISYIRVSFEAAVRWVPSDCSTSYPIQLAIKHNATGSNDDNGGND